MSLDDIAQFVTKKVGQTDATSLALCYSFINARFKMIYDAFFWRDSQVTGNAAVNANQQTVALPAGMDRVVSIRASGDHFLDPIDANLLIQTDPTIFERTGVPTVYEELTETAGNTKQIKVYPTPTVNTALFILGKRTPPTLADSADVPILRNIDNCLIAYATGDMLERQRQYAKAQAKFEEAGAMLEAAKALETAQGNQPRKAKQLTVAGNSLAEMTDAVCARTGAWSLDSVLLIKEFLRRNYQGIYDSQLWSESTVVVKVNSDGEQVILPEYIDRIISVRGDANLAQLQPADITTYFGINPQIFENTGAAVAFSYLTPVAVSVLPTQREKLSFVSTNIADKTPIFIKAEVAGIEVSESINLNGTTPIVSGNNCDVPLTVAKGITAGDVSVKGNTSGILFETILAAERERKHIRLWLQPHPGTAQVCLILGKRKIRPLVQDEDTPLLRGIQNCLIAAASADMFTKLGNDKGAADARTMAGAAMQTLLDLETQQTAVAPRVIPYVEPDLCWAGCDDWIVSK